MVTHFTRERITGDAKKYLNSFVAIAAVCALTLSFTDADASGRRGGAANQAAQQQQVEVAAPVIVVHNPAEAVSDWNVALQFLKDGNKRFVEDQTMPRNTNAADRNVLKDGQKPFAVVITCADSRVAPEIYFDQKLGDIFVIRNAGNIASPSALGSIEYAVEHLRSPLVVVVGHSRCGAVTGAFSGEEEGHAHPENLQIVLNAIRPAIANSETVDDGIRANVGHVVGLIRENSVVEHVGAKVIGAYYNIETGEVLFDAIGER